VKVATRAVTLVPYGTLILIVVAPIDPEYPPNEYERILHAVFGRTVTVTV
jgi:hypothetical protein